MLLIVVFKIFLQRFCLKLWQDRQQLFHHRNPAFTNWRHHQILKQTNENGTGAAADVTTGPSVFEEIWTSNDGRRSRSSWCCAVDWWTVGDSVSLDERGAEGGLSSADGRFAGVFIRRANNCKTQITDKLAGKEGRGAVTAATWCWFEVYLVC
jgi:hypothetical protein